ncbi:MAG: hypothetical protein ACRD3T_09030 [Terriglobia bacterium]
MISEDQALEKANQLHPELQNWGPKDFQKAEIRDGVNWQLHLEMDAVVLRRESDPSLPDAAVVKKLQEKGVSRADAIHRISKLVVEDIWDRMKGPPKPPGKSEVSPEAFDDWAAEKNQILNQKILRLTQQ